MKLTRSLAFSNMVLYNEHDKLYRYDTEVDIMKEFYSMRKKLYDQRKTYLLKKLLREYERLSNKARFVVEVVEEKIKILKVKKQVLVQTLRDRGFKTMSELDAILAEYEKKPPAAIATGEGEEDNDEATVVEEEVSTKDYDYLLSMPVMSLTYELVEKIKKQREEKKEEHDALEKRSVQSIWEEDIENFLKALDEYEAWEEKERQKEDKKKKGAKDGNLKHRPKRIAPKKEPNSGRKEPNSGKKKPKKEPDSARSFQKNKQGLVNPVEKQKAETKQEALSLMDRLRQRNPELVKQAEQSKLVQQPLGQKKPMPKFDSEKSSPAVMPKRKPAGGNKKKKMMATDESDEEESEFEDEDY